MTIAIMKKERKTCEEWFNSFADILKNHLLNDDQRTRLDDLKWGVLAEFDAEICYQKSMAEKFAETRKLHEERVKQ